MDRIEVKGARIHNLKGIDVTIPRNTLTVFTGVSGSGKSSLAFDTIYAEGQRRYLESLSPYARQFLGQMNKPEVELIEGLSPAIAIEQKSVSKNPRSTVGTTTDIYDYLRLLYARVGHAHCPSCAKPIVSLTIAQMTELVLKMDEGSKVVIMAPLVENRKGAHAPLFKSLLKDGFVRVRVNGEIMPLEPLPELDKAKRHTIDAVVDRVAVQERLRSRIAESLELALRVGGERVLVVPEEGEELLLSEKFACDECGIGLPELTPQLFSFNSPVGACQECNGLGVMRFFDPERIVPDPGVSLEGGAIKPWGPGGPFSGRMERILKGFGSDLTTPFRDIPREARRVILEGPEGRDPFPGVIPWLIERYHRSSSMAVRKEALSYVSTVPCPGCKGGRLKPEGLAVRVGGLNIFELTELPVGETVRWFGELKLSSKQEEIAQRILKEVRERLTFLKEVGLDYLSLSRSSATLSAGEGQRIRLATQLGSRLTGVLYVLDEPSIGLHMRDNERLLSTLVSLKDAGNTVLVVEHDRDTILSADHVVDMGPGAGEHGGEVVYSGPPEGLLKKRGSITGDYLDGRLSIELPEGRRSPGRGHLVLEGARANNLKNLAVHIPIGLFTTVTGVSGSGKSTLVVDTLYRAMAGILNNSREKPGAHERVLGSELFDKVINIDHKPIGRTPRSNPATYTGLFTPIRQLFSEVLEARARGYRPGRFSFNVKGGRCEACRGEGLLKIEMHFLPDVQVTCEICGGKRYNQETLEVRYRGLNISDVLNLTVRQALSVFGNVPRVKRRLEVLNDVGMGYIRLGQPATTLSGGEAQRVKLALELSKRATGRTLYILDEPTTGLHFDDVRKLLSVLFRLRDEGNTVVVIEHNMDVVKMADHIIDLGPEGGDRGGFVVAAGTPEEIARTTASHTGRYLSRVLNGPGRSL